MYSPTSPLDGQGGRVPRCHGRELPDSRKGGGDHQNGGERPSIARIEIGQTGTWRTRRDPSRTHGRSSAGSFQLLVRQSPVAALPLGEEDMENSRSDADSFACFADHHASALLRSSGGSSGQAERCSVPRWSPAPAGAIPSTGRRAQAWWHA